MAVPSLSDLTTVQQLSGFYPNAEILIRNTYKL